MKCTDKSLIKTVIFHKKIRIVNFDFMVTLKCTFSQSAEFEVSFMSIAQAVKDE